jgi:hypothetical protein
MVDLNIEWKKREHFREEGCLDMNEKNGEFRTKEKYENKRL